jgi:hypothetical protein
MIKLFICISGQNNKNIYSILILIYFFSADQSRPNNADLFLLLLNNTSRPFRKEFELQKKKSSAMAHRYQRKPTNQTHPQPYSARPSTERPRFESTDRVNDYFLN